ncbi:MAG TPA: endonuclease domain-containing protein [Candidatus Peribacteraceae bacterium]|nr:endonuclease domain-containing protein [Candidatus Peribacteraceae bacterium]
MLRHLLPTTDAKIQFARRLRGYRETTAERRVWFQLQNRQLHGLKFRRQVPLGPFIADFLCVKWKLIVELDGDSHDRRQAYDRRRTLYFEVRGLRVIRFTNEQVFSNLDGVLIEIVKVGEQQKTKQQTFSLPRGES